METENFKKAREIFKNAIEIKDPAEQEIYLDNACAGDQTLRIEVEALLRSHDEAGDFLVAPGLEQNVTLDGPCSIEGPGTKIGRYKLLELIGEGGMGLVYLAEQQEPIRRKVALKIVKLGMDTKQVIARFEAERQALAVLDHPNIAHVYDAGATETGRPYFVMEYVKGVSITKYCDERKLNIEQRLRLFEQVCEGVHHAHQKGIIHRDIKPSNILVSVHGDRAVPKIIDFGIAKAITQPLTEETFFTQQGQLLGTLEYMSPEQVDMATQDIDTRSDIYSLGVVLYELLAGVLPFEKGSFERAGFAEIQQTIRELEPASPSIRLTSLGEKAKTIAVSRGTQVIALARRLHRELEWIPLKAMRKDRCRRYKSASEMVDDIRNYLNGNPLIAGPETAIYRVKKFVRKHAGSVTTVALVAVVIILGLVVSTAMYFRAERALNKEAIARTEAEQAREKETIARVRAEQAEKIAKEQAEDYRRALYFNRIALADLSYRDDNIRRLRELLDSCPEDLRGWEWYRLNHISDQSCMMLRGHTDGVWGVAVSPDNKRIVSCGEDQTIKVWDAVSGAELMTLSGHEDVVWSVAISPDGKRIVSGSNDKTIKVWDAATGAELMTLLGHKGRIRSVSFSGDGRRIVSGGTDNTVRVWDAATGKELMTLRGHEDVVWGVAISPDGKRIASCSFDRTMEGNGTVTLWDGSTGAELMTLRGHEGTVYEVGFSPDGKRIASTGEDNTVKVWDVSSGAEMMTLCGHSDTVQSVAFSPDGKRIVSGSRDKMVKIWDAATGVELMTLPGHEKYVSCVTFSPDGKRLISGSVDKTVKVWDVSIDHERMHVGDGAWRVSFSPDSKRVLSGSIDGKVTVWDRSTGTEMMALRGREELLHGREGDGIARLGFSPDGKRIFACQYNMTKIWDAATGAELMSLHEQDRWLLATFSPDSRRIASWSVDDSWDNYNDTIDLRDAATGEKLMTLHGRSITSVAFSPDGERIVSGGDDETITVWDAETGEKMMTRRHEGGVSKVAFSPDGKRIASVDWNQIVKLWDADTLAEVMTLPENESGIWSMAFSPDGKRIVLGDRSGMVEVWDVATGTAVMTLRESGQKSWRDLPTVDFSSDGKAIAIGISSGITLLESGPRPTVDGSEQSGESTQKVVD